MQLPDRNSSAGKAHDFTEPIGFSLQVWMAQQPPHEDGHLGSIHCRIDDAVSSVAQLSVVETEIAGEKSGASELLQKRMISSSFIPLRPAS
jgi:hypothetical protein